MDWTDILNRNSKTFWGFLGMELLHADAARVDLGLEVKENHLNSMGIVHGGVLSSLMDQAMGILVTAAKGGVEGVTTHLNVNFLSAMGTGKLIASAYPVHETFRTMTMRAEVRDEQGQLGCVATSTFRLPKAKA
ncbi:thioesterase [Paenibacillus yonginensis]|uniref:Thioesterase n=1 Tax=Paenibacillus yonginensis TaxID=1462996 RepID=A0A1B1MY42_9BACL|nr:PaaI family thioesterase [Paenibacillus yonginensis]ANS74077.1 thioesterase [Paenibacillus yonginensis]